MSNIQFRDGSEFARAVNIAASAVREQMRYAVAIAEELAPPGNKPDPVLIAAALNAIATVYASQG